MYLRAPAQAGSGCVRAIQPAAVSAYPQRLGPMRASRDPIGPLDAQANPGPIQLDAAGAPSRRGVLKALALGAGMAACPCCTGEALASGNTKFEYGALSGPLNWGGTCAVGQRQSPINVPLKAIVASQRRLQTTAGGGPACRPAQLDPRGYKASKPRILNTGVGTMQANFDKGSQIMVCGGQTLELLQFHFHTPSEHAFDGERTAMEVHLVHKNTTTGQLAVVGVLMESNGPANPVLATALKYAPTKAREETPCPALINPAQLLPRVGEQAYVRYNGSLTTPGCGEGVDWYVVLQTITISPEQALAFAQYVSGGRSFAQNARPLQPLNGRAFDVQYDCGFA